MKKRSEERDGTIFTKSRFWAAIIVVVIVSGVIAQKTKADNKKAIYTSVWTLNKKSKSLLDTMKKSGITQWLILKCVA